MTRVLEDLCYSQGKASHLTKVASAHAIKIKAKAIIENAKQKKDDSLVMSQMLDSVKLAYLILIHIGTKKET